MADLADQIGALASQAENSPAAMIHLARLLRHEGQVERALVLCQKALTLAPMDAELVVQARAFLSEDVPAWHFSIVRDHARNAAYEAALRRAIQPGSRVLEIGTGTGLLAMMAARAGAEVVTCEMNPAVAMAAREIIARNGYSDRVRVVVKHSSTLDAEVDLGGPADILVSEIVSNDLVGEAVLPVHEYAVRRLLKPGAIVIPARGRVRIALGDDAKYERRRLGLIEGFDLTPFNRLALPHREIAVSDARLTLRSEVSDLFAFDFALGGPFPPTRREVSLTACGGQVNGIAQWLALDLDARSCYENKPEPNSRSCWAVVFRPFEQPVDTRSGETVTVRAFQDGDTMRVWVEPGPVRRAISS